MIISIFLPLIIGILMLVSMWKIFTKAGKPGWAILIPIYNIIIMLEIAGKPWWWLFLVWILAPVFGIWMLNLMVLGFGKTSGFTVGCLFLPFIFIPILGLGSAKYSGPVGK